MSCSGLLRNPEHHPRRLLRPGDGSIRMSTPPAHNGMAVAAPGMYTPARVSRGKRIMSFKSPKGWKSLSDTLFVNADGVRIERRLYREKEGWFLIPAELSQDVIGFDPTPEGRDQAFAAFASGVLAKPGKKKAPSAAKPKKGRKPKEGPEEDSGKDSDEDPEETTDDKDSGEEAGQED
jgi:hypothetical protein